MRQITGKPTELKNVNTSLIMKSIRTRGSATRGEISNDTGLSHTTVRAILTDLLDMNEILSVGLDISSGGRRAERYEVNPNKRYLIAISIEENKIIYRVVNTLGEVIEEDNIIINSLNNISVIIKAIDNLYKVHHNIEGIGISVPGVITEDGYLTGIRMEEWKEIKIKKLIKEKFNIPIVIENDINSAAIAFYNDYIEKNNCGPISLVYISFSSLGVGSGIIVNGNVIKGDNGYAGEIGFIPVEDTYLNVKILNSLKEYEYCSTIINTIKTISAVINPSVVVLGGSSFRYNLRDEIINRYNREFKIKTKILVKENEGNYSLEGIKEKALCLINKEVKLIKN
ncbi:ROK family protein [Clostridium nigeriense]|uniref:ROK family protein n=1 Tax=Clostridium nigeriense TaxID=1805470 RepID=UPI00082BB01D|nr:ROK family protein [Clostridium nigeriense]